MERPNSTARARARYRRSSSSVPGGRATVTLRQIRKSSKRAAIRHSSPFAVASVAASPVRSNCLSAKRILSVAASPNAAAEARGRLYGSSAVTLLPSNHENGNWRPVKDTKAAGDVTGRQPFISAVAIEHVNAEVCNRRAGPCRVVRRHHRPEARHLDPVLALGARKVAARPREIGSAECRERVCP